MRRWFITGVSSGLGRALAVAALEAGDLVAGTVRSAEALRAFNALHPQNAKAYLLDVTDHNEVATVIAGVDAVIGGIDILVNNAGYSFLGTLEESEWPDIRAQYEANVFGPVAVIKAALPAMRARRAGLVINVTSSAGYATIGGVGFYAGTKLALEGISKALRLELAPFGIGVMIVVPGAYRTLLGENRKNAVDKIPDYAPQNAERQARMAKFTGVQRGDPAKAAQAIMQAAAANPAPRHLVLGPDAYEFVTTDLAAMRADMADWDGPARGTDFG